MRLSNAGAVAFIGVVAALAGSGAAAQTDLLRIHGVQQTDAYGRPKAYGG